MSDLFTYALFVLGAFFCGLNFFLSFLREPLLQRRGVPTTEIEHVSGAPLVGSLFVLVSLPAVQAFPGLLPLGIALILIDTGGLHWFVGIMLFMAIRRRSQSG